MLQDRGFPAMQFCSVGDWLCVECWGNIQPGHTCCNSKESTYQGCCGNGPNVSYHRDSQRFLDISFKEGRAVISLGVDRRGCILDESSASALHSLA